MSSYKLLFALCASLLAFAANAADKPAPFTSYLLALRDLGTEGAGCDYGPGPMGFRDDMSLPQGGIPVAGVPAGASD